MTVSLKRPLYSAISKLDGTSVRCTETSAVLKLADARVTVVMANHEGHVGRGAHAYKNRYTSRDVSN